MSQTVLLTLGRLPKALDFARSFHRAGWKVLVAEPFKSHLTGASNCVEASFIVPAPCDGKQAYLRALASIAFEQNVDLVLPLSEETQHVAHLSPLLPASARVFSPAPDVVLELHDKAAFIALAARLGLAVPETAQLGTPDADQLAAHKDYVIKPVFSCSGKGVSLHKAAESLPDFDVTLPNNKAIVQEQLKGQEFSTFAVCHTGQVLINVTYRGTIMSGSVAVAFERVEMVAISEWVSTFVAKSNHSGFISFDFFIDEAGVARAIECNPRVTSGVHFIETDDLAPAILMPSSARPKLKRATKMMQFYPTLTEVQGAMFSPEFTSHLQHMISSTDVTWSQKDLMPFLTMPITAFTIISKSIRQQKTFGEVSTDDIAWFE